MKSLSGIALAACLLPTAVGASPGVDVYRELIRYQTNEAGASQAFAQNTRQFLTQFLQDPGSPYSELIDTPFVTNELWWPDFVDSLPLVAPDPYDAALKALQRQSGLTKARPGIDVDVDEASVSAFRGVKVASNAAKAGVDPDIFWQAWDMNDAKTTVAAGYAVALQMLRDQIRTNRPADYGRMAIKPDVLSRYMAQRDPDLVSEYDQRYLADLLRYDLSRPGTPADRHGGTSLPAAYRVARTAAAYFDSRYDLGYCENNDFRAALPGDGSGPEGAQPLCFVEANDRAVQSWYRRQLRIDAQRVSNDVNHGSGFSHLLHWVSTVLVLIDFAAFVEVVDAVVADDLAAEGAISEADAEYAADRAHRLTCRIRQ
jgi:hypothetical protein